MMNKLAVALGCGLVFIAAGARAADDWVLLAETDGFSWEGRAGTRVPITTRGGTEVWVAEGRVKNKKTSIISFEKWYVPVAECLSGSGKLVTLDMAGNFKYESEFVLRGGSVASSLADVLCLPVLENAKKGI